MQTANARIANGLATTLVAILNRLLELPADFLLRRENMAHYPHIPSFYSFHFPLLSQLFGVEEIPSCLSFLELSSSSSSGASVNVRQPSSASFLPASTAPTNTLGTDIPAHAMLASLCYHILALLSHLFKYSGTLKELVQYKKLGAFIGLFKPLSGGDRQPKQNAKGYKQSRSSSSFFHFHVS